MNYVVSTPIGIDSTIQEVQIDLYNALSEKWAEEFHGRGRVYKNKKNNGSVCLEYYLDNNNYEDVYFDDSVSGTFFFIDDDNETTEDEKVFTNNVKVAFIVDLSRIYPSDVERVDALARYDVVEILRNVAYENYEITGTEKGIENVFSGFNTENIKFDDIHPYHCFAVNIKLTYNLNDRC